MDPGDLTMRQASTAHLTSARATPSCRGPSRVRGDTAVVTEMARAGDFENVTSWVIGIDQCRPFRVLVLTGPGRLVIDVSTR